MSDPFITTTNIIYLILIFLVWEQLGPDELKSQTAAQFLPDQEVSALSDIATTLTYDKPGLNLTFDKSFCIKCNITDHSNLGKPRGSCADTDYDLSFMTKIKCLCFPNNNTCHVKVFDWSSKELKGTIPEKFGNLIYLEYLDLSYNKLEGSIPDIWGHLSSLYMLDLSQNKLTGEIPKSLRNMKPRKLESKSETCIRFELDLSFNQLEGSIPAIFGDLDKDLTDHGEQSLKPSSSCDIASFKIDLSHNHLNGSIPANFGNLKFLSYLYLDNNLLTERIPKSLSNITYLRMLSVTENQLTGPIPEELGQLKFLSRLWLDYNNFTGKLGTELRKTFSQLKEMEYFSIAGNNLTGPFPKFIREWPNIKYLSIAGNNFWGNITPKILERPSLRYLEISDLANSSFQFPKSLNWTNSSIQTLILRNCLISGSIPENIGLIPNLYTLDLSFNNLTGLIPSSLRNVSGFRYISLAENKLEGTIPEWIRAAANKSSYGMDLSFNDFSDSSVKLDSNNTMLNLFSCCRSCNSANCTDPLMKDVNEYNEKVCPKWKPKNKTLHINCGGEETNLDGMIYESDNDSSPVYKSPYRNWVRISSGEESIVAKIKCEILVSDTALYDEARVASVSLKYYGFCLEDGEYNVTLHFAEIKFTNNPDEADQEDQSFKKRIFNIIVQNKLVRKDFNIKEAAGEAKKEFKLEVPKIQVNNSQLEIHLYWAGKGSSSNGPLISAISVVRSDMKPGKLSRLQVALISVASVVVFVLLLLFFIAWAMGWLRKEEIHEIGVGPNKTVTLKQLMDATRGFSREKEIGRGGLGIVYKAKLPDKQMVAVKKLSTLSSEGIGRLKSESYTLKMLTHENLVQLFDLFIGKDFYLLIYEYMENRSLANVLFGPMCNIRLSWEVRFNICLGIAKGLQYLHEHPRLKMVHRGIKAVNILLDSDLKPKISDFGLASVYAEDGDHEAGQLKIIKSEASHGYMAPEYPLYGTITTKYDVYGYGVVILELVSGKKNAGHKYNQELEYLVDEVCLADSKGKLLDLVDKNLGDNYDQKQAITLLKLAVKCIHISHILRPSMAQILSLLTGEKTLDKIDTEIANTSSAPTKKEDFAESST